MALAGSGNMSIGTNLFGATRCIRYEILGSYGAYSLSQADAATGQGTSISDYYGYSHVTIPTAPSSCNGTWDTGDCEMTVTWNDNSSNEDNFRLERNTDSSGFTFVTSPAANDVSYIDGAAGEGSDHVYRVRAENTAGDSAWSTASNENAGACE